MEKKVIKKSNSSKEFFEEEYIKCINDFDYFFKNYVKIPKSQK